MQVVTRNSSNFFLFDKGGVWLAWGFKTPGTLIHEGNSHLSMGCSRNQCPHEQDWKWGLAGQSLQQRWVWRRSRSSLGSFAMEEQNPQAAAGKVVYPVALQGTGWKTHCTWSKNSVLLGAHTVLSAQTLEEEQNHWESPACKIQGFVTDRNRGGFQSHSALWKNSDSKG